MLKHVTTGPDIDLARDIFREYQQAIGVDLCFQDFDHELANLPGEYAPPSGCLLFWYEGNDLAGCAALRKINGTTCEMKRMYVRSAFRGKKIGRKLAESIVAEARELGYKSLKLDTLPAMREAIALYRSLGFKETPPYRVNPHPGAVYMELDLS